MASRPLQFQEYLKFWSRGAGVLVLVLGLGMVGVTMRQQGQYPDSGLGSYSVSQMHQVPSQRMEQSHPDPFEGRLEAFTPERENSYIASKNEDQWRWERDESKMPNSMASHMFNEGKH
ncbi:hypothetical protein SDJN02_27116, partial [Cucurbita argyrosperma subsp. argyrosperma]